MSHYKRLRPKSAARACSCGTKGCKRDGNAHTALDERREPASDTAVRTWPGKKDTRRWCGGHEGREHELHWQPLRSLFSEHGRLFMEEVCRVCGKKLRFCWPPWGWPDPAKMSPYARAQKFECICGSHKGQK